MNSQKVQIPEQGFVSVKVFDALGRDVRTLVNKLQQPGNYRIIFNASKLASGVYYYRLHINHYTKIKKMLVLK